AVPQGRPAGERETRPRRRGPISLVAVSGLPRPVALRIPMRGPGVPGLPRPLTSRRRRPATVGSPCLLTFRIKAGPARPRRVVRLLARPAGVPAPGGAFRPAPARPPAPAPPAAPPPSAPRRRPRPVVTVTGDDDTERPLRMVERALGSPSGRRGSGWHDHVVV